MQRLSLLRKQGFLLNKVNTFANKTYTSTTGRQKSKFKSNIKNSAMSDEETISNKNTSNRHEDTKEGTNVKVEIPNDVKIQHVLESHDAYTLFSVSRPQHAVDGLSKGIGNIVKGTLGGAAMIVSAPIIGAVQGGNESGALGAAKGFGMGLGMGIVGGSGLILGGCLAGITQIGRGLYNTPIAMYAYSQEKEWDNEKKDWIVYNLKTEIDEILNMSEEDYLASIVAEYEKTYGFENLQQQQQQPATITNPDGTTSPNPNHNPSTELRKEKTVSDKEYYDFLGIPTNATQSEIKKAYYIKAKQSHPDRHPNDPEAHMKFQKIGEAYQVLSDEKLRANYDAGGKAGVEGAPKMESGALFAMIFGSEKFDSLLGELQLASQMQAMQAQDAAATCSGSIENHPKIKAFKQKKREIKCAASLVEKLQSYVDSKGLNEEAFKQTIREEAKELAETPFGGTLVTTIGTCYNEYARQELDPIDNITLSMQQTGRNLNSKMTIASSGIQAALTSNSMNKLKNKGVAKKQQLESQKEDGTPSSSSSSSSSVAEGKSNKEQKQQASKSGINNNNNNDENMTIQDTLEGLDAMEQETMKQYLHNISIQMFTVMWAVTELDIRNTLAHVCKKVTHDHSVDQETRTLRCKGLQIIGNIFLEYGGTAEAGMGDIMNRMGAANTAGHEGAAAAAAAAAAAEAQKKAEEKVSSDVKEHKSSSSSSSSSKKNATAVNSTASSASQGLD